MIKFLKVFQFVILIIKLNDFIKLDTYFNDREVFDILTVTSYIDPKFKDFKFIKSKVY